MKKINPWEANDLAGDYEERGFHPTKWEEVTETKTQKLRKKGTLTISNVTPITTSKTQP